VTAAVTGAARSGAVKAAPRKAAPRKAAPRKAPPVDQGMRDATATGGVKTAPAPDPTPTPDPAPPPTPGPPLPPRPPQWAATGAGFVLGLLFWTWVALPFLKDGPAGVQTMLKAKFTNKAPDGSWLP
jgi:hypothetical protein